MAEHIRRVAETARILNDAGLIAICAFVSPLASHRAEAARLIGEERFIEVHVDAPLAWCEARDQSGLYEKARRGEVKNVAGMDSPYETPSAPKLTVRSAELPTGKAADSLLDLLRESKVFPCSK